MPENMFFLLIIQPSNFANHYLKIVSIRESHCWFSHHVSLWVLSAGVSITADCGAVSVGSCDTAKEARVTELGQKLSWMNYVTKETLLLWLLFCSFALFLSWVNPSNVALLQIYSLNDNFGVEKLHYPYSLLYYPQHLNQWGNEWLSLLGVLLSLWAASHKMTSSPGSLSLLLPQDSLEFTTSSARHSHTTQQCVNEHMFTRQYTQTDLRILV